MAVTWVNRISGAPLARDFVTTSGLGPALCVDVTTGILYYLSLTDQVIPIIGRRFQPEVFGAKGDGATDDYAAFVSLKTAVNAVNGGEIDFRSGANYFINRYVGDGQGTAANDMMFDGLNFLKINGNGATISVMGAFNRAVVGTQPLSPLKIRNSFRVSVADLILNGNVQSMTKAGGVTEPSAEGLWLAGCYHAKLDNIESHHNAADGLYIGGYFSGVSGFASRRVKVSNFYSHHNARNAFTVSEVRGLHVVSSNFDDSGQSAGTYGQHSPCSSLDIEPSRSTASPSPNTMDVDCGDITFEDCEFNNSNRNMISAINPSAISNVTFINCRGTAPAGLSAAVNAVYFDVNNGLMDNCYWDCGSQAFALTNVDDPVNTRVEIRSTIIKGAGPVLFCNHTAVSARVSKCRIISTAAAPLTIGGSKQWPWQFNCTTAIIEDTDFYLPKEAFNNEGVGDFHVIMQNGLGTRFNLCRFTTNLPANQSGATTAHFANAFTAGNTTPVFSDKYTGTVPGAADTFRPTKNDTFNTTGYYDRNH